MTPAEIAQALGWRLIVDTDTVKVFAANDRRMTCTAEEWEILRPQLIELIESRHPREFEYD